MRYDADIGVIFGTATRSSYEFRFLGTQIDYSEETSDQVARSTLEGQATWSLQLNPVLAGQVIGNYLYYDAQNPANTQIRRGQVGVGVVYTPSEIPELGLGIDYADRQREDTVAGVRETTESDTGPGINGEFSYDATDFVVVSGNAALSTAAPSTRFTGALRAAYILPRGRVTGRVYQNYTGTRGGGDEAPGDRRRPRAGARDQRGLELRRRFRLCDPGRRGRRAGSGRSRHQPHEHHRDLQLCADRGGRRRYRLCLSQPQRGSGRRLEQRGVLPDRADLRNPTLSGRRLETHRIPESISAIRAISAS